MAMVLPADSDNPRLLRPPAGRQEVSGEEDVLGREDASSTLWMFSAEFRGDAEERVRTIGSPVAHVHFGQRIAPERARPRRMKSMPPAGCLFGWLLDPDPLGPD